MLHEFGLQSKKIARSLRSFLIPALMPVAIALSLNLLYVRAARSAEEITLTIFGPLEITISLAELEKFAAGEPATGHLALLTNRLDDKSVADLRASLRQRIEIDVATVARVSNTPILESAYRSLGRIIQGNLGRRDHWRGLRGAVITAAAQPEGLTLLNFIRQYPLQTIRIDLGAVAKILKDVEALASYHDVAIEAIARQSQVEIAASNIDLLDAPDPRDRGPYAVAEQVLSLHVRSLRQTRLGLAESYKFDTDVYIPQNLQEPAPLIVISHGLGARPQTFAAYGQHLASHGYVVVIPEHIGSDAAYQAKLLRGQLADAISPTEFVSRPRDITYLLNGLERLAQADAAWRDRINFEQIGAIGHSLGGYTVLALAGAPLNRQRLDTCTTGEIALNLSLLLQCRAGDLDWFPNADTLADRRIKAVIAVNALTSRVLGPESLSQIAIPTMMVTGTNDLVAPAVPEQIHPFVWLQAPNKYLATFVRGTHTSVIESPGKPERDSSFAFPVGPRPDVGRSYLKGLSLAFFETHTRLDSHYRINLSAAYARQISHAELGLYLVSSLEPEQLEAAYGKQLPFPVMPKPLAAGAIPAVNRGARVEIERVTNRATQPCSQPVRERGMSLSPHFDVPRACSQFSPF